VCTRGNISRRPGAFTIRAPLRRRPTAALGGRQRDSSALLDGLLAGCRRRDARYSALFVQGRSTCALTSPAQRSTLNIYPLYHLAMCAGGTMCAHLHSTRDTIMVPPRTHSIDLQPPPPHQCSLRDVWPVQGGSCHLATHGGSASVPRGSGKLWTLLLPPLLLLTKWGRSSARGHPSRCHTAGYPPTPSHVSAHQVSLSVERSVLCIRLFEYCTRGKPTRCGLAVQPASTLRK
jgi:hypothetical protein